jgi:hypothetical protein
MDSQGKKPQSAYDFILKEDQKTKKGLGVPKMSKPMMFIGATAVLMIALIIFGVAFGGKGNKKQTGLIDILGQAQEISRVNTVELQQLHDPTIIALESTTQSALASDQAQIKSYLSGQKTKVDVKKLATYQDSNTDAQLKAAAQNNNLDNAYKAYLRTALSKYSNSLQSTYVSSTSVQAKTILKNSYDSTQTLLASPAFK